MYNTPAYFPSDDPNRLWMLLSGRMLTQTEYRYWSSRLYRHRKLLPAGALFTVMILSLSAMTQLAASSLTGWEKSLVSTLLFACALTLCVAVRSLLRLPEQHRSWQYAAYAADRMAVYGTVMAVYDNRVTVTSPRGTRTWFFTDITACVETHHGFALCRGKEWLIFRAADLTAFDARMLEAYLKERLQPHVWDKKGEVKPQLAQPLPIPTIPEPEDAIATVRIQQSASLPRGARQRETTKRLVWAVIPALMLCGTALSVWLPFTKPFIAVLAAYVGGVTVVGALLVLWFYRYLQRATPEPEWKLQFEPQGVRFVSEDLSQFCPKEYFYFQANEAGITLRFKSGEELYVPTIWADEPAALLQFCGIAITR